VHGVKRRSSWFAKGSKRVAKPSSANGGSSTEPLPIAWKRPVTGFSFSAVCRKVNGAVCAPRMQSNGCTKSSRPGSRRRPCCRLPPPPACYSGRRSLPARAACARSMAGRRSPKSSSPNQSISPPNGRHYAKWTGTWPVGGGGRPTAREKLTSELPTSSFRRPQMCFERRSIIRYLYVPEIALRNSHHILDGTRFLPGCGAVKIDQRSKTH